MKKINLLIALLSAIFVSCDRDRSEDGNIEGDDRIINEWILENMQEVYFWNDEIPKVTDMSLSPSNYFKSLLSKEDRFSWIQENFVELLNSLSGVNKEAGYDFNLVLLDENTGAVAGYITYIKSGTPAETAGLKRGDLFTKINDATIDINNYTVLLNNLDKPHSLNIISDGNSREVSLDVIECAENPIFLDSIYIVEGKKTGYLIYNFFAADNGDKSDIYDKKLNEIFGRFKSEGISELILDLRYNGGGSVMTAANLASLIVKDLSTSKIFCTYQYNKDIQDYVVSRYGNDYLNLKFVDKIANVPVNNIGDRINRVYVIATGRTASASELIINGLKPYMEVIPVGGKTYGKNVASWTIYEEDEVKQQNNKWGMQPIVLKLGNSAGSSDYGNGFSPDIECSELSRKIMPLGDSDETMLATTMDAIAGRLSKSSESSIDTKKFFRSSADVNPGKTGMYFKKSELNPR